MDVSITGINSRTTIGQIYINTTNIKHHLFRIKGWDAYPIVTGSLKIEMEKHQVYGITFNELICEKNMHAFF
jgi:hypothetical protein